MNSILIISIILLAMVLWLFFFLLKKKKRMIKKERVKQLNQREKTYYLIYNWLLKDKRYLDPGLKLDRISRGLHLSERDVSSAINSVAGENFNAFINRLRIKEAQSMLTNPKYDRYTIDGIAEMVGFSNKVSFYQAFKRVTNQSPRDFRKSQ